MNGNRIWNRLGVLLWGAWMMTTPMPAWAWDYSVHRVVNQAALGALPPDFPAFVTSPAAAERIAFLSGEPDRWRNTPDLALKHCNGPDHYIDVEDLALYGLDLAGLPPLRYDFVAKLAEVRAAHPDRFAGLYEERNEDHTRQLIGLLPWTICESYSRLKSGFSYLNALKEGGGTPEEIANAQANIVYVMGVMGHYVGDAVQPLHTTKHYNGWVGDNPNGYTTSRGFHQWIDGGFLEKTGLPTSTDLRPRLHVAAGVTVQGRAVPPERLFAFVCAFIQEQHSKMEPLYALEKRGGFTAEKPEARQGREMLEQQLAAGAQLLANLWVSAWKQAPPDTYLLRQLKQRAEKPVSNP